jgi:hypothetical protein
MKLAVNANDAVPSKLPIISSVTSRLPLNEIEPDTSNEPVSMIVSVSMSSEPEIVWLPINVLEPVVANVADPVPSNRREFAEVSAKLEVVANEAEVAVLAKLEVVANDAESGYPLIH